MAIKRKNTVKPTVAATRPKAPKAAAPKIARAKATAKADAPEAKPEVRVSAALMKAISEKLSEGFSFSDIVKAVKLTGKAPRPRKESETPEVESGHSFDTGKSGKAGKAGKTKAVQFERPGREFPVSLRKLGTLADHKATFRESLTKVPKEFGVRMTHFNKLVHGDETGLVINVVRRSGVWCFVALNAKSKRTYVPVETVIG